MNFKKLALIPALILASAMTLNTTAAESYSISAESGIYTTTQLVFIYGDDVYYTTDGSKPDSTGELATNSPIVVSENTKIRTVSYTNGEPEYDAVTLKIRTTVPTASKDGGTYTDAFKVTLSCTDETAKIYYTTDGSAPTLDSSVYKKAITVTEDMTLKFFSISDNKLRSAIITEDYKISTDVYKEAKRQALFELVNKTRAEYGLAPLKELPALSDVAQQRARECSSYFSHWRANGTKWDYLLTANGLSSQTRAENIAYYYTTAKSAMKCWMNDSFHRGNILNPDAKYIGIGYYDNGWCGYWTQLFLGD